ncbi:Uncharacterised protein [uncultured Clostridium sp.]|nr:Uncharacterised protein [uncultured Clostridium sp.]
MFLELVGFLNYSPQAFFMLEPCECFEIMQKARTRFKFEHELMYVAFSNAIGSAFSKNYKYNDVFKSSKSKKEVTKEEKQRMKEYFENW